MLSGKKLIVYSLKKSLLTTIFSAFFNTLAMKISYLIYLPLNIIYLSVHLIQANVSMRVY